MFIGARSVKMKPQFNFMNYLDSEVPHIIVRARREIDGTVRRLSMGKFKQGDFIETPGVGWD